MLNKLKILVWSSLLLAPFAIRAQTDSIGPQHTDSVRCEGVEGGVTNPLARLNICDVPSLVDWIIGFILGVVGLVAVVSIMLAGWDMIWSSGDPEKLKAAKSKILWSLLGLVVVILAWSLVRVIINIFTGQ